MRQAEAQHMPTESAQAEIIKEKYTILSLQVLHGLLFSADFAWIFFQSFFNNFNVVSEFFSLCGALCAHCSMPEHFCSYGRDSVHFR